MQRTTAVLISAWAMACASEPSAPDAGFMDGSVDAAVDAGTDAGVDAGPEDTGPVVPYLTRLETPADLQRLNGPTGVGVKYLANVSTATRTEPLVEDCYFQNMNLFDWHLLFLKSFDAYRNLDFESYQDWVLRPGSRRWWGGFVRAYPNVQHPTTGALGIVIFGLYSEPGTLTVADVADGHARLTGCIPFAADFLLFLAESTDQQQWARQNIQNLLDAGVTPIFPEQLRDGSAHEVYSAGEGYGTLRIFPEGTPLGDHGPLDIVMVENAPNDISVVQGLITRAPQNALSHTNLRLLEKGVPNVSVAAIYEAPYIAALKDTLVHLVVTEASFIIEPATLADAEAFWASRRPDLPPVEADLQVTELGGYGSVGHADADAYGAKAANLGELYDILPPAHRTPGFAIPFARYADFVATNGIDTQISATLADPRMKTDAAFKRNALSDLRRAIKDAPFPAALLDEIEAEAVTHFGAGAPSMRLKFRSSTNVEDLDVLTGAGLYDSKSGCFADDRDADAVGPSLCLSADERADKEAQLAVRQQERVDFPDRLYLDDIIADLERDLNNEKPASRAIKKVWASLWNERAFDEREYYGVDHLRAFMGVAVNPSFVLERASAVAITHLDVDGGDRLYRVSSQVGSESVVRPDDPTAIAERLTFRRTADAVADVMVLLPVDSIPGRRRLERRRSRHPRWALVYRAGPLRR